MTNELPKVNIYADGSLVLSRRQGGWAALIKKGNEKGHTIFGSEKCKNSYTMELRAILEGVKHVMPPSKIVVHTDLETLVPQIKEYARLVNKGKVPRIKPTDPEAKMWKEFVQLMSKHRITAKYMGRISTEEAIIVHDAATQSSAQAR